MPEAAPRAPLGCADDEPVYHPWFDKWLSAGSPATMRLTQEAIGLVEQYEEKKASRRRKRKPEDERNYRTMAEAIMMNLAHAALLPSETGYLAVLLGKPKRRRTRYDHPAFGDTFASLIRVFADIGWLDLRPSPGMGEASAIAPTARLRGKVCEACIGLADFHRGVGETVILSRDKQPVDYPDTAQSVALRSDMDGLNAFLARADITLLNEGAALVDIYARQQRRYFSCSPASDVTSFERGGRMFGGWWSNLPKARRKDIRIEGEPVATLDFSSMFVRLAYARMGKEPPDGDLYDIPGFKRHRRAAKLIVNCLLFDEHERRGWPRVTDPRQMMPDGLTMTHVRAAIHERLPDLTRCFGHGLGHSLMLTESTIIMEVLKEMKGWGLPGLGLHDGLMVSASQANKVKHMMEEVSRWITSATIPVKVEQPKFRLLH